MKRLLPLLLLSLMAEGALLADSASDEIREAVSAYATAFSEGDLENIAQAWSENATISDKATGQRTTGRETIVGEIAEVLKAEPDLQMAIRVETVQMLKPDLALVEGQSSVVVPGTEPGVTDFTAILMKRETGWEIQSVSESPAVVPQSASEALAALEWLEGTWVDDADGVRVLTSVRWAPNRTFLTRSFLVEFEDGELQKRGTQVIGYDPRSREIRSWTFNADGSFGNGVWSRNGDEWVVRSTQTLADGRAASGTYVIAPEGENSLRVGLIGHSIEGEPQPTRPAVVITRVTPVQTGDEEAPSDTDTSDSETDPETTEEEN